MPRVTGIGGIFFRSEDPDRTADWYREHLGIPIGEWGWEFRWRDPEDPDREGYTAWSAFGQDSDYFGSPVQDHMVNYRVDDLDAVLDKLAAAGIGLDKGIEELDGVGRFAWVRDPDGRRIELWEPYG